MVFSHETSEYWVLLPFFEKVEEATGKLIDLGESVEFDGEEHDAILRLIEKELEDVPKSTDELFLQDDSELLSDLLEKIKGMIGIASKTDGNLSAISTEA